MGEQKRTDYYCDHCKHQVRTIGDLIQVRFFLPVRTERVVKATPHEVETEIGSADSNFELNICSGCFKKTVGKLIDLESIDWDQIQPRLATIIDPDKDKEDTTAEGEDDA